MRKLLAFLTMFFIIIAALLTSFQLAIYGDSDYGFYEDLYRKYNVTEDLNMELSDVMEVTDYMMDYLIGKEDELSIVTNVDGREQDFFNEQDRLHMADVRRLFLGGLKLRNILAAAAFVMIAVFIWKKSEVRRLLAGAFRQASVLFGVLTAALVIGFMVDFTTCFTIFHKLFFRNDLWLFDPATDYMIRMLPEGFFYQMAIQILLYFVLFMAALGALFAVWKMLEKKREKTASKNKL